MEAVQQAQATVVAKEGVYDLWYPEMDPHGDPIFKVAFQTDQGVKIFEINSIEYYRLQKGMSGLLTWKGDQLLTFGKWIHPFSMNNS